MKDIEICEPLVLVRSTLKEDSREALKRLAENILRK